MPFWRNATTCVLFSPSETVSEEGLVNKLVRHEFIHCVHICLVRSDSASRLHCCFFYSVVPTAAQSVIIPTRNTTRVKSPAASQFVPVCLEFIATSFLTPRKHGNVASWKLHKSVPLSNIVFFFFPPVITNTVRERWMLQTLDDSNFGLHFAKWHIKCFQCVYKPQI